MSTQCNICQTNDRVFDAIIAYPSTRIGPAELLDPFLLRPTFLALAMHLLPGVPWAVIIGKVVADLIFYTVAISSFELRQKLTTKKSITI